MCYFQYFVDIGECVVGVLVVDEVIQLFVGEVVQDFGSGGVVVVCWVGWVGELVGQELVVLFGQFGCFVYYVVVVFGGWGQDYFGVIGMYQFVVFD